MSDAVEVEYLCAVCDQPMVEVSPAEHARALLSAADPSRPAPPRTLEKLVEQLEIGHRDCARHVRCATCSPAWWCACVRLSVVAEGKDPVDG